LNNNRTHASVSVIIPAYQAEQTIVRALESITAQSVLPKEVIVIDDGSGDNTIEAAENMRRKMRDINLMVLRQDHKGAGAARNKGLHAATTDYVAFLDADDEWLPEKLARSLEEIRRTNSMLVSHNYLLHEPSGREIAVEKCDKNFQAPGDPFVNLYKKGYIATSAVVAKREAVIAVGGFDESLLTAQDFALWLELLKKPGTPFHIFPDVLIRYHITDGSISSHTEQRLECSLKIAMRFASALTERPGSRLFSFWYRIIAVHFEALNAYLSQQRYFAALGVIALLPVNLLKLTLSPNKDNASHGQ
jgi:teichuronic acid biosynthesis glycosyltransferase TuaG